MFVAQGLKNKRKLVYTYKNSVFHNISPSRLYHKNPGITIAIKLHAAKPPFLLSLVPCFFRKRQLQRRDKSGKKKSKEDIKKRRFFQGKSSLLYGGSGWIRTTEVTDNRFTVCPLWPLGYTPIFNLKISVGAGGRTRTPDLLITNQLLYQLSYTSKLSAERKC